MVVFRFRDSIVPFQELKSLIRGIKILLVLWIAKKKENELVIT